MLKGRQVEGVMRSQDASRIKAVIWMDFVYVSLLTGRAAKHPEEWMDLFNSVRVDGDYDENGFNQRVAALKTQN